MAATVAAALVFVLLMLLLLVGLLVYLFYPALTSAAWGHTSGNVNRPILGATRPSTSSSTKTTAAAAAAIAALSPVLIHVSSHGRRSSSYESNQQQQQQQQQQPPSQQQQDDNKPVPSSITPPLLSVIIPAYNEEVRLPLMLEPALAYLSDPHCPALRDLRRHHHFLNNKDSNKNSSGDASDSSDARTTTTASTEKEDAATVVVVVEWIVVSDGSTDSTERVYREFCQRQSPPSEYDDQEEDDSAATRRRRPRDTAVGGGLDNDNDTNNVSSSDPCETSVAVMMHWKFLALPQNQGKGGAVRAGMLSSTGRYRLMVDADGATQFDHLSKLASALLLSKEEETDDAASSNSSRASAVVVWGSRAHLQDSSSPEKRNQRSLPRQVLMRSFHAFVKLLCTRSDSPYIRDTQCGFKLFPAREALQLFSHLHLRGWAFDTELLILSSFLRIPIVEVPVNWHEVDGSKLSTSALNVLLVSASMLRDMICVRLCYEWGIWTIHRQGGGEDDSSMSMSRSRTTTAEPATTSIRSKSE
jgi:dolichyl-phosphate beta-glucosyltransferase